MRTDSKKLKLVYLMRVFKESTDATHGLTIPEIIKKMGAYGFTPERKSLYDDIDNLRDYGIDIDLELFDYEENICVTLGEHIFLQVKGTESLEYATIKPIGKQIYTKKELDKMQISVLKFVVDVSLLKLVERIGSAIPVLLIVVDIINQTAYYVCLNEYVRLDVLPFSTTFLRRAK